MSLLFLDIETYISEEEPNSGLNPFYKSSKVIVISYNYYENFTIKQSDIKKPLILKEWTYEKNGEKVILKSFYDFLKNKVKSDRYIDRNGQDRCSLTTVGYNQLQFDLPYLFGRLLVNSIDNQNNIFQVLFKEPSHTDLMQLTQLISQRSLEHEKLIPINQKNACEYFGLPIKEAEGKDLSRFYDNNQFDLILKYIGEEFTFEQLYLEFIKLRKNSG